MVICGETNTPFPHLLPFATISYKMSILADMQGQFLSNFSLCRSIFACCDGNTGYEVGNMLIVLCDDKFLNKVRVTVRVEMS